MSQEIPNAHINAQNSQGFVNNPKEVTQHNGNKEDVDTGGGDYVGRDQNVYNLNLFLSGATHDSSTDSVQDSLAQLLSEYGNRACIERAYQDALPAGSYVSRAAAKDYTEMVAQLEDFRVLPQFSARLTGDADIPEAIREKLLGLLPPEPVGCGEIDGDESEVSLGRTLTAVASGNLKFKVYLQIKVTALKSGGLTVNAWLRSQNPDLDPDKRDRQLDLEDKDSENIYQIEDVPSLLNQYLEKALYHLSRQRFDLTIEVFLPLNYLCTSVDTWEIRDTVLLGTEYRVIVRSQERLEINYLTHRWNDWQDNWERVQRILQSVPNHDDFEHVSEMHDCNWKRLSKYLKKKLGLKLTCGLVNENKKHLFDSILSSASPIAIWPRVDLPHLDQVAEINQLISSGPLSELILAVRQKREEADFDDNPDLHIGSHLAVLWEDPDRLTPDVEVQFKPVW